MKIRQHKRRTGHWCSIGQGSGSVQDDHDDDDDDDDDTPSRSRSDDPEKKRLIAENKRRRQRAREYKEKWEAAERKLAESGRDTGGGSTGTDSAELVLAMVSAGMKPDRIRAAMKLVDFDSFDDPDDAIDDLRSEHPFLFTDADDDAPSRTGRTAPSMNNGRQKPGRETKEQRAERLSRQFPALQGRVPRGRRLS